MKKFSIILAVILATIFTTSQVFAQNSKSNQQNISRLDVELDPLAYLLKGYSVHLGLNKGISRWNLGFVGFEYPEDYNDNTGITARTNGISLKWDYINPKLKGFYFGPQSDLSQLKLTSIDDNTQSKTLNQATLGLRAGYRLMFGSKKGDMKNMFKEPAQKGFYLNIWAAYIFNPTAEDVNLGDEVYKIPSQVFFPTVHLGWKF
ncbi:MAG: hypothetical protein ACK4UK_05415 [Flavobacterium sp.]